MFEIPVIDKLSPNYRNNRKLVIFEDSRENECIELKTIQSIKLVEERCREVPTLNFQIGYSKRTKVLIRL